MIHKLLPRAKILQSTDASKQLSVDTGNGEELIPISTPFVDFTKLGMEPLEIGSSEMTFAYAYCDTTEIRALLGAGPIKGRITVSIYGEVFYADVIYNFMTAPEYEPDLYQAVNLMYFGGIYLIITIVFDEGVQVMCIPLL